jgi:hypothetical protein
MIHNRIKPHDGSNEQCPDCEEQIDRCVCSADAEQAIEDNRYVQEWEDIAAQLDYWRDLDIEYWRQRKESEYERWLLGFEQERI